MLGIVFADNQLGTDTVAVCNGNRENNGRIRRFRLPGDGQGKNLLPERFILLRADGLFAGSLFL